MTRIKIHISNVKLPFYPPCEVKCGLQNMVSTSCKTAKETWDVLNIKVTNLNSSIEEFIDVVWLLREDEGGKDWEVIATNV